MYAIPDLQILYIMSSAGEGLGFSNYKGLVLTHNSLVENGSVSPKQKKNSPIENVSNNFICMLDAT